MSPLRVAAGLAAAAVVVALTALSTGCAAGATPRGPSGPFGVFVRGAGHFAAYMLYAWLARQVWKRHGVLGLVAALGLLDASIAADQFIVVFGGRETPLLEDGLKLAGAFVWAAAQIRFAALEAAPPQARARAETRARG